MMSGFMPVCLNCTLYSWKQIKIPSPFGPYYVQEINEEPLFRCKKCKVAHYCDKECQLEHWEKVHKERCKYQSGDKRQIIEVHRHLASKCNVCQEEKETVRSKKEPHWSCHLQSRREFWDNPINSFRGRDGELYNAPLAVELGELTGKFTSQLEHVVSVLQQILHKMDVSSHFLSRKEQFEDLTQKLFILRHEFLMKAAVIPSGRLIHHSHSAYLQSAQQDILKIIRELGNDYEDNINDVYRLWDTFVLLFDYFLDVQKDMIKDFEDIGQEVKDKKIRILLSQNEGSVKVKEKWDKIVSALKSGPAPYITLFEIIIDSLNQECSVCKEKVIIESTFGDHPSGSIRERRPVAICQGFIFNFHCGKVKCLREILVKYTTDNIDVIRTLDKVLKDHEKNRCDWCKIMRNKVHRCSRCLTKVYCSQQCLDKDWQKVHKDVCKVEPDARKKKKKVFKRSTQ